MAYGITSEKQVIDTLAIRRLCASVKEQLKDFDKAISLIEKARDECNKDAMLIEGMTVQGNFDTVIEYVENVKRNINGYMNYLIDESGRVRDSQLAELEYYREVNNIS